MQVVAIYVVASWVVSVGACAAVRGLSRALDVMAAPIVLRVVARVRPCPSVIASRAVTVTHSLLAGLYHPITIAS